MKNEVVLMSDRERLLASVLGTSGEHERVDRARLGVLRLGLSLVRHLYVVRGDVLDPNVLGLELTAEAGAMKGSTCRSREDITEGAQCGEHTEHRGFVSVDVEGNLGLADSRLHGCLDHGRTSCATGKDDTRHVVLSVCQYDIIHAYMLHRIANVPE